VAYFPDAPYAAQLRHDPDRPPKSQLALLVLAGVLCMLTGGCQLWHIAESSQPEYPAG
jgi:hypothetical protein